MHRSYVQFDDSIRSRRREIRLVRVIADGMDRFLKFQSMRLMRIEHLSNFPLLRRPYTDRLVVRARHQVSAGPVQGETGHGGTVRREETHTGTLQKERTDSRHSEQEKT